MVSQLRTSRDRTWLLEGAIMILLDAGFAFIVFLFVKEIASTHAEKSALLNAAAIASLVIKTLAMAACNAVWFRQTSRCAATFGRKGDAS